MPDGGHLAIATALVRHEGGERIALSLTDTGEGGGARTASGFTADVSSVRGRGTNVTILLERASPSSAPEASSPAAATATQVVLVAERDALVRRAVQRVLESHGFTVVAAASQDEALAAAAAHPLSVAMLDCAIFRRAPTTFLHRLRALAPKMRLVLLADQALPEDAPRHVVVLAKPLATRSSSKRSAKPKAPPDRAGCAEGCATGECSLDRALFIGVRGLKHSQFAADR
jgi:CheY-like chemotaxis protein